MNIQKMKDLPIDLIMGHYNIPVAKKYGNSTFYFAPWRDERNPSLKVDTEKNLWIDFGDTEKAGSPIDLVMQMENISCKEAIKKLEQLYGGLNISFNRPTKEKTNKEDVQPSFIIHSEGEINDTGLVNYITEERKIPIEVARKYCVQLDIEHRKTHKRNKVIGMKNNSGSFEIRGLNDFKSCIEKKDFSFFETGENIRSVLVVEGLFDLLSAVVLHNEILEEPVNYLCLNSLSTIENSKDKMIEHRKIYIGLDWDFVGRMKTRTLLSSSDKFINLSARFQGKGGKDLNDVLCNRNIDQRRSGLKL